MNSNNNNDMHTNYDALHFSHCRLNSKQDEALAVLEFDAQVHSPCALSAADSSVLDTGVAAIDLADGRLEIKG